MTNEKVRTVSMTTEVAKRFAANRGDRRAKYGDPSVYDLDPEIVDFGLFELRRMGMFDSFDRTSLSRKGMTFFRAMARSLDLMPDEMTCGKPRAGRCPCGEDECHCVPRHTSIYGSSCARCGSSMKRVVDIPRDPSTDAWVEYFASKPNEG